MASPIQPVPRTCQRSRRRIVSRVVRGVGLVFLLLEPVQHDARIRDPLEPGQAPLDLLRIGLAARGRGDALGPPRGVLLFLFRETDEYVSPLRIGLAVCEVPVCRGRFDFAPPHLLDGDEIAFVHHPVSLSTKTTLTMPETMSST